MRLEAVEPARGPSMLANRSAGEDQALHAHAPREPGVVAAHVDRQQGWIRFEAARRSLGPPCRDASRSRGSPSAGCWWPPGSLSQISMPHDSPRTLRSSQCSNAVCPPAPGSCRGIAARSRSGSLDRLAEQRGSLAGFRLGLMLAPRSPRPRPPTPRPPPPLPLSRVSATRRSATRIGALSALRERRLGRAGGAAGGRPPVPLAEQLHQRRDQERADDRGVDQDRERGADAVLLHEDDLRRREGADGDREQQRRSGDDAPGALESDGHRLRIEAPLSRASLIRDSRNTA